MLDGWFGRAVSDATSRTTSGGAAKVGGFAGVLWLAATVAPISAEPVSQNSPVNHGDVEALQDVERPAAASERAKNLQAGVCADIRAASDAYQLPQPFFSRLIWMESGFNPKAVSPAGAIGIAQFMPSTAQWRGLNDPLDSSQAIRHSARWLSELRREFGNLGLAAAAYNAGPRRVRDWLANKGPLPDETRAYVRAITGRPAEQWIDAPDRSDEIPAGAAPRDCKSDPVRTAAIAASPDRELQNKPPEASAARPAKKPWGLQLIGGPSKDGALRQYAALQQNYAAILGRFAPEIISRRVAGRKPVFWYQIRVSEVSRERATALCSKLKSAGGACLLVRN
jgi:hypothetical protein